MAEVWVATSLTDDGDRYGLVHADDLRHLRLVGEKRPRLLAQLPGGEVSGWVPLVDSAEQQFRVSPVVGVNMQPPLPDHFHLQLVAALDAARLQASEEGHSVVVRAVVERDAWVWRAVSYSAFLGQRRPALTEVSEPRAAAS